METTTRVEPELHEDAGLPYLLSVPHARAPRTGWPVLFFLHGLDEGAPSPPRDALSKHGPFAPMSFDRASRDFIIIAPQLPTRGDVWALYKDEASVIVDRLNERHALDRHRLYLTGFSFGGNGVFDLAAEAPGMWAALWPVDPTRPPETDPDLPVWLSSGEISRRMQDAFIEALGLEPAKEEKSGDKCWFDYGVSHVETARRAYADDRIYAWLLAKERELLK